MALLVADQLAKCRDECKQGNGFAIYLAVIASVVRLMCLTFSGLYLFPFGDVGVCALLSHRCLPDFDSCRRCVLFRSPELYDIV